MKQMDRTKVCWSCEADVNYEATYCPFCGTDLLSSSADILTQTQRQDTKFSDQSLQESLASLYKPPYSIRNRQGFGVPDEREEKSFNQTEPVQEDPLFQSYEQGESEESIIQSETPVQKEEISRTGNILPLLSLMIGSHFFVLGTLLLFCSKDAVMTLEWSSRLWFVYCLVSFPLLYVGVRKLKAQ